MSNLACLTVLLVLCADQWNVQAQIKRTNESLIARGYVTWFDLTNMKGSFASLAHLNARLRADSFCYACSGSTMDAMSDAIEGADVMLYGVSLAYKESANVSTVS